jgi:cytoskeletal protein CcmA (bactofilin family)
MFSKTPPNNPPQGANPPAPQPQPQSQAAPPPMPESRAAPAPAPAARPAQKLASLIASDMVLEGSVSGGGEIQIDGVIKGDVRVERVNVGDGGTVEGGIFAEAVEVRGKVSGSITAKQVRLYGACHVDGDITHEQLAMETGAFFQGRSLRLQRPVAPPVQAAAPAPRAPEPAPSPPKDASANNGNGAAKPAVTPPA